MVLSTQVHVSQTLSCCAQVYAMPVYDMIEYQLVKHRIPNGFVTRLVYRTIYIILVAFVAITLPFFGGEHPPSMHVCAVNVRVLTALQAVALCFCLQNTAKYMCHLLHAGMVWL